MFDTNGRVVYIPKNLIRPVNGGIINGSRSIRYYLDLVLELHIVHPLCLDLSEHGLVSHLVNSVVSFFHGRLNIT